MGLDEMNLSDLRTTLAKNKARMRIHIKQHNSLKKACSVIEKEIAKRKLAITNIKIGDVFDVDSEYNIVRCGMFLFMGVDISIQITGLTNNFVYGALISGRVYESNHNIPRKENTFKVSTKNFFEMAYKQTKLRDVINRDQTINSLLDE